ncbi:hypothetical protein [Actinokineospora sp.]|uniref:hypothetical protein n=1 Tax=Actinokineospora sp. TaxID=1872133 RepID=UPI003D6AA747
MTTDGGGPTATTVQADEPRWYLSRYDDHVHAFDPDQSSTAYSAALCSHTAPNTRIICTDHGTRCLACLLIHGDQLADRNGDVSWRL